MMDDATVAFRIPKHHPDVATDVSMLAGPYLLLFAGGVFGSKFSAASWETFAWARCELATYYSPHNIQVPEYKEYLDVLMSRLTWQTLSQLPGISTTQV